MKKEFAITTEPDFKTCTVSDVGLLAELGRETYYETFADMNSTETMAVYLESAFNKEQLKDELRNPNSLFLLLYSEGKLAGYLKINEDEAQTEFREKSGLEVERIYLRKEFQGQGLGNSLMKKAISIANDRNKKYIWLGVWEHNEKAIAFYKHKGFKKVGNHAFIMGDEQQNDFLMRKELS